MPRRKHAIPVVRREIPIPADIAAILETMFWDSTYNRIRVNAIPEYIVNLIRDDLKRRGLTPGAKQ